MKSLHKHILLTLTGLLSIGLTSMSSLAAEEHSTIEVGDTAAVEMNSQCDEVRQLEPKASLGLLTESEIDCLNDKLEQTESQTGKEKLSLVLMAQAYSSGTLKSKWAGSALAPRILKTQSVPKPMAGGS